MVFGVLVYLFCVSLVMRTEVFGLRFFLLFFPWVFCSVYASARGYVRILPSRDTGCGERGRHVGVLWFWDVIKYVLNKID